jgi:hypothetical protein
MAAPIAQPVLQAPDHCTFTLSARAEVTAALCAPTSLPLPDGLVPSTIDLLAPPTTMAVAPEVTVARHGPPLIRRSGPSRAPPIA